MYDLMNTKTLKEVKELHIIFRKKKELENTIANLIRDFEDETGFAIDIVKYQRDITLPLKRPHYLQLSVVLSEDELEEWGEAGAKQDV
jgi:hypothetical protein